MTWSITLADLRTGVRHRGGYRRSTSLTDTILDSFINSAISQVHEVLLEHSPERLLTSTTLTATVGVDTIALPATFFRLRALDLIASPHNEEVKEFLFDDRLNLDPTGESGKYRHRLQAGNLVLIPTPTVADQFKCWFLPHATKLVSAGDLYDGINGYEELVMALALKRCRLRDSMGTQDVDYDIKLLMDRVHRESGRRNLSGPSYMPDHGVIEW